MKKWLPGLLLLAASYHIVFYPIPVLRSLLVEDGPFENLGAVAFLSAGILFLVAYRNSKHQPAGRTKNIFFLLLGCLFIFIAGEEISWGQRLIGFPIGDFFTSENIQQESNLHNLKLFNSTDEHHTERPWWYLLSMSRLFRIFWFTFGLIIPLVCMWSTRAQTLAKQIRFPLIPLEIGLFFPVNYILFKTMELMLPAGTGIVELEECVHGMLFLLTAGHFAGFKRNRLFSAITFL